ncbi:MAG TPA: hypothetical protein VH414_18395 [Lichenihabitans sp.]|jgi:hypothetical protein|nr:hypothetical protein [Lichenihabitans sp.]
MPLRDCLLVLAALVFGPSAVLALGVVLVVASLPAQWRRSVREP